MHAVIAKHASHKLVTFKDTLKHLHKGEQLLIAQTSGSKFQRRPERAFYSKAQTSASSIHWLERTSKLLRKHIHYALCGHGVVSGGLLERR